MRKMRSHKTIFIPFLLMLLSSCSLHTFPQEEVDFFPDKEKILLKIKSEKSIRSIRASVSFQIFLPGTKDGKSILHEEIGFEEGSFSANAFLVWKNPNSFRMEILSPFGNPYLSILAHNKSLKIFHVSKQKLYISNFNKKTMGNLFGIPVDLHTFLEILSVLRPKLGSKFYKFDRRKGILFPLRKELENSKTFWIDKSLLMPKKVEVLLVGQKIYVHYDSFVKFNGVYYSKSILIRNPSTKAYMKIDIGELNSSEFGSVPSSIFSMDIPSNISIHRLFMD